MRLASLVALAYAVAGGIVSGAGCSSASPAPYEPPSSSPEAGTANTKDVIDAPPTTFIGQLNETSPTPFGGTPYCKYTMTMKSVVIEVSVLGSDQIVSATVSNTTSETVIPPCDAPPQPVGDQRFNLSTATTSGAGTTLAFEGAPRNYPITDLFVDIVRDGNTYEATASWHRLDVDAPLDWRVTQKLTLRQRR